MNYSQVTLISLIVLSAAACSSDLADHIPGRHNAAVVEAPQPQPPDLRPSKSSFAIGSSITAAGAVAAEAETDTFFQETTVYLSVRTTGLQTGSRVEVKWIAGEEILAHDARTVASSEYEAFRLEPENVKTEGIYSAEIVIDGRVVAERRFAVLPADAVGGLRSSRQASAQKR